MLINKNNGNQDFFSDQHFPDKYTHRFFMNADEIPNGASKQILIAFGEHCISNITNPYDGSLLKVIQKNISDLILHLLHFQNRANLISHNNKATEFIAYRKSENHFLKKYLSESEGLEFCITKLFSGIAKQQENQTTVSLISTKKAVIQIFLK